MPMLVCPFCSLNCDDVDFSNPSIDLVCNKALVGFQSATTNEFARIGNAVASIEEVIASSTFRKPVSVITRGTDLTTARTLSDWNLSGAIRLSIESSLSADSWRSAVSREGVLSATLGDVLLHSDCVWSIGNPEVSHPRLYEKIQVDKKRFMQTGQLDAELLAELAFALRFKLPNPQAEMIRNASYLAILIGESAFAQGEETAVAELLCKLVRNLNDESRAVAVLLDDAATNRCVTAWKTNESITPVENLTVFDVRIGTPGAHSPKVRVQIGGVDLGQSSAECYLPCQTIGIDRSGVTVRGDATVTLPLVAMTHRQELFNAMELLSRLV